MAVKYERYEIEGQKLIEAVHKGDLFKQICVEGLGKELWFSLAIVSRIV